MTKQKVFIHWFRQDLRITDNPSLYSCAKQGLVLPIYILDDINSGDFKMGRASRYFLYHSLQSLNKSLEGNLKIYKGDASKIIENLISKNDIKAVQWNRCYEPWRLKRDKRIQKILKEKKVDYLDFNGSLLWEPWEVAKNDGNPYKVFTPFYKNGCLQAKTPQKPLDIPENIQFFTAQDKDTIDIKDIKPDKEFFDQLDQQNWKIGEQHALKKLEKFIKNKINKYGKGRDYPGQKNVSRLSPHLHFGEVSPHQVWYQVQKHKGSAQDIDKFRSEVAWREFAYYILYHFPEITTKNYQNKFDDYPWQKGGKNLKLWQEGKTGYPMVDAAMRELNQTGYMHNRSRMIVASFLTKNLYIHWKEGERYFWDRLMDADLASNSASWQWVAGCGLDASPFFRVFNIVTQGQKFDPDGDYVYKYCPELKNLPLKFLFDPSNAPEKELKKSNIKLGKDYPFALVDLKQTRAQALKDFKMITEKHKKNKNQLKQKNITKKINKNQNLLQQQLKGLSIQQYFISISLLSQVQLFHDLNVLVVLQYISTFIGCQHKQHKPKTDYIKHPKDFQKVIRAVITKSTFGFSKPILDQVTIVNGLEFIKQFFISIKNIRKGSDIN